MKIDPKEYRVEILNGDGSFVELNDVMNIIVNTSELSNYGVIQRFIENIVIDCIIDGKVALLIGNEHKFRFYKRS